MVYITSGHRKVFSIQLVRPPNATRSRKGRPRLNPSKEIRKNSVKRRKGNLKKEATTRKHIILLQVNKSSHYDRGFDRRQDDEVFAITVYLSISLIYVMILGHYLGRLLEGGLNSSGVEFVVFNWDANIYVVGYWVIDRFVVGYIGGVVRALCFYWLGWYRLFL
jgi:hypothetical protein